MRISDWSSDVCSSDLALLDVRALQANDERHRQIHFLRRGDDAVGDDVAFHDAAEDVDEDALYRGVLEDDLERRGHLFLARAAADVEEVRREFAVALDDIHRPHRQTGTIEHSNDAKGREAGRERGVSEGLIWAIAGKV